MYTPIEDDFLVMTNFNNHQFWGVPYDEVTGVVGSYRYRTAYANIMENINNFDFDNAIETLDLTKQSSGSYPTICSFIFDPIECDIYIILNRNYDQIYRISLNDDIVETYPRFD